MQPEKPPFNIYKKVGPDANYLAKQRNSRISEESHHAELKESNSAINQEYEKYLNQATFSGEKSPQDYTFNKVPSEEVLAELMKSDPSKVLIQEGG